MRGPDKKPRRKRALQPLNGRFWKKVLKTNSCWVWTGAKQRSGHGAFNTGDRTVGATHVAWFLQTGHWPKQINHHCDNSSCVRFEHLYEGTQQDNIRDRNERGRTQRCRGEQASNAKISETTAFEILNLKGKIRQIDIAARLGVSRHIVAEIHSKRRWRHLA